MSTKPRQCELSKTTNRSLLSLMNTGGHPVNTRVRNNTHCNSGSGSMFSKPAPYKAVSQRNGLGDASRMGVSSQFASASESYSRKFSSSAAAPTVETHTIEGTSTLLSSRWGSFGPFSGLTSGRSMDMSVVPMYRPMSVVTPNRSPFVRRDLDARLWHGSGPSSCGIFASQSGLLSNREDVMPPQSRYHHHPVRLSNDCETHQNQPMELLVSQQTRKVGPLIPLSRANSWVSSVPTTQCQVNANESGALKRVDNELSDVTGRDHYCSSGIENSSSTSELNRVQQSYGCQNMSSMGKEACRSHQEQKQKQPLVKPSFTHDYKKDLEMDAAATLCSFSKISSEEKGVDKETRYCRSDISQIGWTVPYHSVPYGSFSNSDVSKVTPDSASSASNNVLGEDLHYTNGSTVSKPLHPTRLSTSGDESELNSLHCYVRSELLELFVVQDDDARAGRNSPTGPQSFDRDEEAKNKTNGLHALDCFFGGRVGFRCVHCAHAQPKPSLIYPSNDKTATPMLDPQAIIQNYNAPMGTFYPKSLSELYRLVCTWQRVHFHKCRHVPPAVRHRYHDLKQNDKSRGKTRYWITSAMELCLTNDGRGGGCIRYFPGSTNSLPMQAHTSLS